MSWAWRGPKVSKTGTLPSCLGTQRLWDEGSQSSGRGLLARLLSLVRTDHRDFRSPGILRHPWPASWRRRICCAFATLSFRPNAIALGSLFREREQSYDIPPHPALP